MLAAIMAIEPFTRADLACLAALQPADWADITPPFRFYLEHPLTFPVKMVRQGMVTGVGGRRAAA
jgi:hypothetical protein